MRTTLSLLAIATLLTGCYGNLGQVGHPTPGVIYNGSSSPIATGSGATGQKRGEACAMAIMGLVGIGEAGIADAAKAGGITQVSSVDREGINVLGIYTKACTVVHGN